MTTENKICSEHIKIRSEEPFSSNDGTLVFGCLHDETEGEYVCNCKEIEQTIEPEKKTF